jgi:hypothetical protein
MNESYAILGVIYNLAWKSREESPKEIEEKFQLSAQSQYVSLLENKEKKQKLV